MQNLFKISARKHTFMKEFRFAKRKYFILHSIMCESFLFVVVLNIF